MVACRAAGIAVCVLITRIKCHAECDLVIQHQDTRNEIFENIVLENFVNSASYSLLIEAMGLSNCFCFDKFTKTGPQRQNM